MSFDFDYYVLITLFRLLCFDYYISASYYINVVRHRKDIFLINLSPSTMLKIKVSDKGRHHLVINKSLSVIFGNS